MWSENLLYATEVYLYESNEQFKEYDGPEKNDYVLRTLLGTVRLYAFRTHSTVKYYR